MIRARGLVGDALSPIYYQYVDARLRPTRTAARRSLLASEFWAPDQLLAHQELLLRRLLANAVRTSPWYERRLGSITPETFRLQNLPDLPVLEKHELQAHLPDIAGSGRLLPGVYANYTGGSTGEPVKLYQSPEYRDWGMAELDRDYRMCADFALGHRRAFVWGSDIDSRAHRGASIMRDVVANILWVNAFQLSDFSLPRIARMLRCFAPYLLIGYVSSLLDIARSVHSNLPGLHAIQTAAETLTDEQRKELCLRFGAPVFNRYGSREVGNLAHECDAHEGLHVLMENNILEVVAPSGAPAREGEEGEVLVTNLRNLATPLIRYRIGDIARVGKEDSCVCGRRSPRLSTVLGRTSDIIVTPHGKRLHGEFFTHLFYNVPVVKFRVEQNGPATLRVLVVPGPQYNVNVRSYIERNILEHGDPSFSVEWIEVQAIDSSPSGKYRFTVSTIERRRWE